MADHRDSPTAADEHCAQEVASEGAGCALIFSAMASSHRLAILGILLENDDGSRAPLSFTQLGRSMKGMAKSKLAYHLDSLQ